MNRSSRQRNTVANTRDARATRLREAATETMVDCCFRPSGHQLTGMKRFPLVLCAIAISISAAQAGPDRYSSKETASPPPCPSWYADNEWNVSLWGAYAFT